MAKYINTELMLEGAPTYMGKLDLVSHTKSKVVFQDSDSGDTVIYKGHDLVVKGNIIVSGNLTGWNLGDADQQAYTVISKFNVDLDDIHAKNTAAFADKVYQTMLSGKDTFTGSSASDFLAGLKGNDTIAGAGGADIIEGGKGNDMLTGGANYDLFNFAKGDGNDTITDFNADNLDVLEHDLIGAKFEDVEISATGIGGKDTLIDFGGGSTITLLDVLSTAIDSGDFYTT
jgi:Ca2+-binding RTX toxin-like protein